jgi:hypothetical protein
VKRRIIVAIAAAVLSLGVAAPAAYAVPDFGPVTVPRARMTVG